MNIGEIFKKQVRTKIIFLIIFLTVTSITFATLFFKNNITGNPISSFSDDFDCVEIGGEYGGSFLEILWPLENGYMGNNSSVIIKTDYYGSDKVEICDGDEEEVSNCTLGIEVGLHSDGGDYLEPLFISLPKFSEGNKTYSMENLTKDPKYKNGNYTLFIDARYSCDASSLESIESRVIVYLESPNITGIYPQNNITINISEEKNITITPQLNSTDTIDIKNKTVSFGQEKISLSENPSYNRTLSPGEYEWIFEVENIAGNKVSEVSKFKIINNLDNFQQGEIGADIKISFEPPTPEDNIIINKSNVDFKVTTESEHDIGKVVLQIFNSVGNIIYTFSEEEGSFETNYSFTKDGRYIYNITAYAGDSVKSSESRRIEIDTTPPKISIISDQGPVFQKYFFLEFSAEDENDIVRKWIHDGSSEFNYNSPINKTLSPGNYNWTIYAEDIAGNIGRKSLSFEISGKSKKNSIALFLIFIAAVLLVGLGIVYFMKFNKKSKPSPTSYSGDPLSGNFQGPSYPAQVMPQPNTVSSPNSQIFKNQGLFGQR